MVKYGMAQTNSPEETPKEPKQESQETASAPDNRPVMVLDTPERLKAISHPLRLAILRLLHEDSLTNEEMARALQVPSGKLYFHTKKLTDVGMIVPNGTRQKGPLTEKLYRAAIRDFVAPTEGGDAFFHASLQTALNLYRNTWKEVGDPEGVVAYHFIANHTPENEALFIGRLFALFDEFEGKAVSPDTLGSRQVSLVCLMHGLSLRNKQSPAPPTDEDSQE